MDKINNQFLIVYCCKIVGDLPMVFEYEDALWNGHLGLLLKLLKIFITFFWSMENVILLVIELN